MTHRAPPQRNGNNGPIPAALDPFLALNERGRPIPIWPGKTIFGRGVYMDDISVEGLIWMPDAERNGHVGCIGSTQVGKTRLVESLIEQDIRKGYSVAIVDPKGDTRLFSKVVQVAAESGRLSELMFVTPIFPDQSIYLDPLANYYMQDELVNHVISGIKSDDEFYINVASEVAQVVIAGLIYLAQAKGETPLLTFHDIKQRIGYEDLQRLRQSLASLPGTDDICRSIEQILQNPSQADFFSKVSSSLRTTLSSLTFGNTGRIIGKARTNEFIQRLEAGQRVLLYCSTGNLLTNRVGHIIGKVFVSMIQSLAGRLFASGKHLEIPLCVHLDEGHNVLYPGIQELFNKGGGAQVWLHLYTQSLAQMDLQIGPRAARSIMDSVNSWLFMLVNHPATAQHIEESSAIVDRTEWVMSLGGPVTMRGTRVRQIEAHKVMQLPKRWFYLRSYGRSYKGETLTVEMPYIDVRFPNVS